MVAGTPTFKQWPSRGIRFLLVPEERISLRLDAGVARGDVQFYLSFNEAF